jgi:hypothetical protein
MKKFLIFALFIVSNHIILAAGTNTVWSSLTVSNVIYTNRLFLSNEIYTGFTSNTTWAVSNADFRLSNTVWSLTNSGPLATTNFPVIIPGSFTNWVRVTNGFVRGVTNAAP